jgi:putative ABC transport system ATP-binding protein
MSENQLAAIRNEKIGFVFQFFNLIPTLTAVENVELPMQFSRNARPSLKARAVELLTMVGLAGRLLHRPAQLSGGEQQRVAIARALANAPALVLADEPTGNLDTTTGEAVLDALLEIRQKLDTTLIIVTHDNRVAEVANRVLRMQDGKFFS